MDTISTTFYEGSINHFRAAMLRLATHTGGEWIAPETDVRLVFGEYRHTARELVAVTPPDAGPRFGGKPSGAPHRHYKQADVTPPLTGSWIVIAGPKGTKEGWAGIEAYEERPDRVRVDFIDGYRPTDGRRDLAAIGPALGEFARMIAGAIGLQGSRADTEPPDDGGHAEPAGGHHPRALAGTWRSWLPKTEKTLKKWGETYEHMLDYEKQYLRDTEDDWVTRDPTPKLGDYCDYLRQAMGWKPCEKTVSRIRQAGRAGKL